MTSIKCSHIHLLIFSSFFVNTKVYRIALFVKPFTLDKKLPLC